MRKLFGVAFCLVLCFTVLLVGIGTGIYAKYFSQLSMVNDIVKNYKPSLITNVYADDDAVIGQFCVERRVPVGIEAIPTCLKKAIIAVEDARFYRHKGIDIRGIIRAFIVDVREQSLVQGGSTITQQLARALFLSNKKNLVRKAKEMLLAIKLEATLSKDKILELYCNQIYFGNGAYGVKAAAQTYYGKSLAELTLSECALLAGVIKAPTRYSPFYDTKGALSRRNYVLKRMFEEGFIAEKDMKVAAAEHIVLHGRQDRREFAPYFLELVRQYVERKYGYTALYRGGLHIYTTLNTIMQGAAESAIKRGLEEIESRHSTPLDMDISQRLQAAFLSYDLENGYLKAMVGGYDFGLSKFNRAVQAKRQPGSAFKPIIYATALSKGYTPASIIPDMPLIFNDSESKRVWKPENYYQRFYGLVTLRKALEHSINVATVKLLQDIGVSDVIRISNYLGIKSDLSPDLSLALGSSSVSLLEMSMAYGVFARGGKLITPIFIRSITDDSGRVLEENKSLIKQVLDERIAYLVCNLLHGVVERGTGKKAKKLGFPIAGKTGTTNQFIDTWFIGFTPSFVASVWVGYDERKSIGERETGARAALPIWMYFMQSVAPLLEKDDFTVPDGIVFKYIDYETGLLASDESEEIILEAFIKGTEPTIIANKLSPFKSRFTQIDLDLSRSLSDVSPEKK